jgi:hypothetical protein
MDTCSKCGVEKDRSEFYVKDRATGRIDSKCKTCTSEDRKAYYEDHKETIAEVHRDWYEANKEKVFSDVGRWRKENPEKVRQYGRTSTARLREINPGRLTERNKNKEKKLRKKLVNRLAKALRNRLRNILKGRAKIGSAVRDLGCSLEELKTYLESRWKEGMSWVNYGHGVGKWGIDHIIPLSAFDLTNRQHVVLACHHLNLQPLWHEENSSKGAKLDGF